MAIPAHVLPYLAELSVHIGAGTIATAAGYAAVSVRKGARLHRVFGTIFVLSMLIMAMMAIYLAASLAGTSPRQHANIVIGIFVLYLLATSWMTVKRKPRSTGPFDKAALATISAVAATLLFWGVTAARAAHGYDGYAAPIYFVFGAAAVLFAGLDLQVIRRGGVSGPARIARHLSRMCTAFFLATASFFLGQQKVMPDWIQGSPVLTILALAPLAIMIFWLIRVRVAPEWKIQTLPGNMS